MQKLQNLEEFLEQLSAEISSHHISLANAVFQSGDLHLIGGYEQDSRKMFEKYDTSIQEKEGYKPSSEEIERDAVEVMKRDGEVSVTILAKEKNYGRTHIKGIGMSLSKAVAKKYGWKVGGIRKESLNGEEIQNKFYVDDDVEEDEDSKLLEDALSLLREEDHVNVNLLINKKGYERSSAIPLGKKLSNLAKENGWKKLGRRTAYEEGKKRKSTTYSL